MVTYMIYFIPVPQTLEELKSLYRKLSRKHHPDVGGSEDSMKLINSEYTELFKKLKNVHIDANGNKYHKETKETPEQLIIIMNQLFKAQKWVESARDDYFEAECIMNNMDEYLFNALWRLCYQAAKKYIISLFVFKHITIPQENNLVNLVEICEKHAKIDLSLIYKECVILSYCNIQEKEYDGCYSGIDEAEQVLKNTEKIDCFVTSYFDEYLIGRKTEGIRLCKPKYLPINKIEENNKS